MLYGQIKVGEQLGPVMDWINRHQATIAGGLGGAALTGGAAYLSADKDKLKKGLLGAVPGALAGGYMGNKYDSSYRRWPFTTPEEREISDKAISANETWDDKQNEYNRTPAFQSWWDATNDRKPWLWEKPFGL